MTSITGIRFIDIVIVLTITPILTGRTTTTKTGPTGRAGATQSCTPAVEHDQIDVAIKTSDSKHIDSNPVTA
jgi:hypothetical protein